MVSQVNVMRLFVVVIINIVFENHVVWPCSVFRNVVTQKANVKHAT